MTPKDLGTEPAPAPPTKPAAKAKGKTKGKAKGKAADGGEDVTLADPQKRCALAIREADRIREKVASCMSRSTDMLAVINSNSEHAHFKNDDLTKSLRICRQQVEDLTTTNTFWRDWLVQPKWGAWVEKNHDVVFIYTEVEKLSGRWVAAVTAVEQLVEKMGRIHKERS